MTNREPAILSWKIFRALLPRDAEAVAGDVAECYEKRRERDGDAVAGRWLRREAAVTLLRIGFARLLHPSPMMASVLIGLLGTLFGVVGAYLKRPVVALLPFIVPFVAVSLYLTVNRVKRFRERFMAAAVAFIAVMIVAYVYLIFFETWNVSRISLSGHAWRLGLIVAFSLPVGVTVALVSAPTFASRTALPAVLIPWLAYSYRIAHRPLRMEALPWFFKVMIPFNAFLEAFPSLRDRRWHTEAWLAFAFNMAIWGGLAALIATLVVRRRAAHQAGA